VKEFQADTYISISVIKTTWLSLYNLGCFCEVQPNSFAMSDNLEETSFDYIVLGTGLVESVLAGYSTVIYDVQIKVY
jgi:hypothetical protein